MITTPDIRLGTFLTARDHPLLRTEKRGSRLWFIIDASDADVCAFYTADDLVSAKRLFEQWRSLRTLIDSELRP